MTMPDTAEEDRLAALHALGVLDTPPEERFDRITRVAQRLFGVPVAAVTLIDRDRQWIKSRAGETADETPRSEAFCDHTIGGTGPMVVSDATADGRFAANPLVTGDAHVRFYAGHPLVAPGGHRVGALCLVDVVPRELTDADLRVLADLAHWVEEELAAEDERDRAVEVQRGLLPREPPRVSGYEVAGGCMPAREVGGDFFDWYPVGDRLQLTIADVMGKGVGAAIIGATVRAVLRSSSRTSDIEDAVAAAALALEHDLAETSAFVTLFTARLDPVADRLSYVDAGHGLTVVVDRDGTPVRLTSADLPIGVQPGDAWTVHDVDLPPGSTLISVSDGLLDFFDTAADVIDAAIAVVRSTTTAQQVTDEITRFARARRATDDITSLVVRREDR